MRSCLGMHTGSKVALQISSSAFKSVDMYIVQNYAWIANSYKCFAQESRTYIARRATLTAQFEVSAICGCTIARRDCMQF